MFNLEKLKTFFVFYLPILVWMGFIFYLSSVPNLKTDVASVSVEFTLRKFAHFFEYAFLAILFARLFHYFYRLNRKYIFLLSFLGVLIFSLSDEFHQLFVMGRSGNFFDVGVDLTGGFFGLIAFFKYAKLFNTKERK